MRPEKRHQVKKTVMVVDDEKDVLALVAQALRKNGFIVREAGSGAEAIAICDDLSAALDLVLSDCEMPRMSGLELAARVLAIRADMPLILMFANYSLLHTA